MVQPGKVNILTYVNLADKDKLFFISRPQILLLKYKALIISRLTKTGRIMGYDEWGVAVIIYSTYCMSNLGKEFANLIGRFV